MENNFTKAIDFRHACKEFDNTKTISDEDMKFILEAGRKSPSSFGIEAWKFIVITNEELKAKLRPACWDQVQITSCSHLVILLTNIEDAKPETGLPEARLKRKGFPQEQLDFYVSIYSDHLKETLSSDRNIHDWEARQTYIAAGNMMTAAAYIGIDSCPVEGFEKETLEKALELDTTKNQVSLVLPFGYRIKEQSTQIRRDFNEVVKFIK